MTIDERAAACSEEVMRQCEKRGWVPIQVIIARHLREAVAERDALLRECLSLYELGWNHYEDKALFRPERGEDWKREADEIHARITAMIGEQA